jgi:hypothetical protein
MNNKKRMKFILIDEEKLQFNHFFIDHFLIGTLAH